MNKRGQYSLIVFVIATFVLLGLTGIVSELLAEQADQINKAQELLIFSDYINGVKTIQYQERQLGIDTAGFYLGSLGIWPHGVSKCGSAVSLEPEDLLKSVPYWRSNSETVEFYRYNGELYADTSDYRVFRFRDVRDGLYALESDCPDNVSPFLLNSVFELSNELFLSNGDHLMLFSAEPVCDYTISCDNVSPSNCVPSELNLQRVIPEGSEYEECIPSDEFTIGFFQDVLNEFFNELNPLALVLINNYIKGPGTMTLFFPNIEYKAEVEKVGLNSLFITFYPISGKSFSIKHESLINASYQGSTIVHNAFDSDFARFNSAAAEVVSDSLIEDLISEVLGAHSNVDLLDQVSVTGISQPVMENYLNTIGEGLNLQTYGNQLINLPSPYCNYYLKEVCQFMSQEVNGYQLYDQFTSDYELTNGFVFTDNQAEHDLLIDECAECASLNKNPCTDITSPSCLNCFFIAFGSEFESTVNDECQLKVDEEITPLLNAYLQFRLGDVESLLEERYGFDWRIDASRLNITGVTFRGQAATNSLFNSSCDHCQPIVYDDCKDLNPDLSLANLVINISDCSYADCGEVVGSIVETGFGVPVRVDGLINNVGNTQERFIKVKSFVDSFVSEADPNYDGCIVDEVYGVCYDIIYAENIIELDSTIESLDLDLIDLGVVFSGSDLNLLTGAHTVHVCVESAFDDDFDLSNSCQSFGVELCSLASADDLPWCCPYTWFSGPLAQAHPYGPCCGDDSIPEETFFNDSSKTLACVYEGVISGSCGNGVCGSNEWCGNCILDCPDCHSDGYCGPAENCITYPSECPDCHSDGYCGPAENCITYPSECPNCCGDGDCLDTEFCGNCPADCGACAVCGDGVCSTGETCSTCSTDCGVCWSCPFVDAWNGTEWVREHESFPFAVFSAVKSTTYDGLPNLACINGSGRLRIIEELDEISFIDEFELYKVKNVEGLVKPDLNGVPRLINDLKTPINCLVSDQSLNNDCLSLMARNDGLFLTPSFNQSITNDWVMVDFGEVPEGLIKLYFIARKQSLGTNYWNYLVSILGEDRINLFYNLLDNPLIKPLVMDWNEQVIGFKYDYWRDGEWVYQDSVGVGNHEVATGVDDFLTVINHTGGSLKVRFKFFTGGFGIDYVGVDNSTINDLTPEKVTFNKLLFNNELTDDINGSLVTGDQFIAEFDCDTNDKFFFKIKGYYQFDSFVDELRKDWVSVIYEYTAVFLLGQEFMVKEAFNKGFVRNDTVNPIDWLSAYSQQELINQTRATGLIVLLINLTSIMSIILLLKQKRINEQLVKLLITLLVISLLIFNFTNLFLL